MNSEMTSAAILLSFFKFFGCWFDESSMAVDIRKNGEPFILRQKVVNEARARYSTEPYGSEILKQTHLSNN
jgi:hypothetical protein